MVPDGCLISHFGVSTSLHRVAVSFAEFQLIDPTHYFSHLFEPVFFRVEEETKLQNLLHVES